MVLIAMSGGVDSSVAAWLLKTQGYECSGALMELFEGQSAGMEQDARAVSSRMGIPFHVLDFKEAFSNQVISYFVESYLHGATPNPCIVCNRFLKFGRFLNRALELGCDSAATGHYARIAYEGGRFLLKKSTDASKDQSYVLYSLTQEQLARTLLPLGGLSKTQVREIALEQGFANAKKSESQDICFVPDGDYAGFIKKYTGAQPEKGRFKDAGGNDLGEHRGLIHYTIGQRRGLGLAAREPLYVRELCPDSNTVVVGRSDELYSRVLYARDINLIAADRLDAPLRVLAKVRYRHQEQPATVSQTDGDALRVEFDEPQRAVTKGQAVVLYDGDTVIGGGTIV